MFVQIEVKVNGRKYLNLPWASDSKAILGSSTVPHERQKVSAWDEPECPAGEAI